MRIDVLSHPYQQHQQHQQHLQQQQQQQKCATVQWHKDRDRWTNEEGKETLGGNVPWDVRSIGGIGGQGEGEREGECMTVGTERGINRRIKGRNIQCAPLMPEIIWKVSQSLVHNTTPHALHSYSAPVALPHQQSQTSTTFLPLPPRSSIS